jgi:hypothetical protein
VHLASAIVQRSPEFLAGESVMLIFQPDTRSCNTETRVSRTLSDEFASGLLFFLTALRTSGAALPVSGTAIQVFQTAMGIFVSPIHIVVSAIRICRSGMDFLASAPLRNRACRVRHGADAVGSRAYIVRIDCRPVEHGSVPVHRASPAVKTVSGTVECAW